MNKFVTGAAIVALVLSGLSFFGSDVGPQGPRGADGRDAVGAQVGPEYTESQYFRANFTVGNGSVATSSTEATYTLTTKYVDVDVPYVAWNVGLNNTLTFPKATSAPFTGLRIGESFEQLWYSATTTAATTLTFAVPAGGGIDLQEDEGGTVIVNGLEFARLTYVKTGASAVSVIVEPYQIGD